MKLAFFATGLVASIVACPWFVAQEPGPASAGQKPGYTINATAKPLVVETSQVPDPTALPKLPAGYTERTIHEYDFGYGGGDGGGYNPGQWVSPIELTDVKERRAFAQAFRMYQSAADDSARSKATAELRTSLAKQYDAFVEGQAKQIAQLEDRLEKLKTQLEKRRGAKERMVELKLQMVLSQAEGLGFPDNGSPNQAFLFQDSRYFGTVDSAPYGQKPALSPAEPPSPVLPPGYGPASEPPARVTPPADGGGEGQDKVD